VKYACRRLEGAISRSAGISRSIALFKSRLGFIANPLDCSARGSAASVSLISRANNTDETIEELAGQSSPVGVCQSYTARVDAADVDLGNKEYPRVEPPSV